MAITIFDTKNVKFCFKVTFINIVILYTYFQPFWRNFNFLNKIFFLFYQAIILFKFLFKNRIAINSR
jgi:hypothetical protein